MKLIPKVFLKVECLHVFEGACTYTCMWFYYYFRIWIFFHLLSKKVLYNYSYRYWCLILLKYRYVLITMLFSIEFNKVFVFLHNCLTFHQCLEWSNSYNGTWSPKILQLSLSEDALDIYLRLTTIVCDDQYYM